jgi:hypothetical protein
MVTLREKDEKDEKIRDERQKMKDRKRKIKSQYSKKIKKEKIISILIALPCFYLSFLIFHLLGRCQI